MTDSRGVLFHAKHAFMPNHLGYCGPDDRGLILSHLEEAKGSDELKATLAEFEAAYPFLKLIARSSGREVFDYSVPEAYWIGNSLLDTVPATEFAGFSHRELAGRDEMEVKMVFKAAGGSAKPNHTFYVLSTLASPSVKDGPNLANEGVRKVLRSMDSCRVSWGEVVDVGKRTLKVRAAPLVMSGGRLRLGSPRAAKVEYDPLVKPFARVKAGDMVSMHWGHACEVLTVRQAKNAARYTADAVASVNRLLPKD